MKEETTRKDFASLKERGHMSKRMIHKTDDRRERWHGHIKTRLDRVIGLEWFMPPEAVAEIERIEGKPIDEIILDRLCNRRGWGVTDPTAEQARNLERDAEAETWLTRCRNRHERDTADAEVLHLVALDNSLVGKLNAEELGVLAAQFYRRGDQHLGPAVGRLVRWFSAHRKGGHK